MIEGHASSSHDADCTGDSNCDAADGGCVGIPFSRRDLWTGLGSNPKPYPVAQMDTSEIMCNMIGCISYGAKEWGNYGDMIANCSEDRTI